VKFARVAPFVGSLAAAFLLSATAIVAAQDAASSPAPKGKAAAAKAARAAKPLPIVIPQ
jgi:hypothetical protein